MIEEPNKMPPNQGKRDKKRPNYNFIPLEFDNELASIFEEGRRPRPGMPEGYGDSWMKGGKDFLEDCLNHAFWHLKMYMRGDRSENHLTKVAWNVLVVRFFEVKKCQESIKAPENQELKSPEKENVTVENANFARIERLQESIMQKKERAVFRCERCGLTYDKDTHRCPEEFIIRGTK